MADSDVPKLLMALEHRIREHGKDVGEAAAILQALLRTIRMRHLRPGPRRRTDSGNSCAMRSTSGWPTSSGAYSCSLQSHRRLQIGSGEGFDEIFRNL